MQVDYSNDFYPKIPFYMTYPMQSMYLTEMEYEKDMERMKQYYPAETKEIMELVEQRLDQLEYEGSRIYDEEPDRLMIQMEIDGIYRKLSEVQKKEREPDRRKHAGGIIFRNGSGFYRRRNYDNTGTGMWESVALQYDRCAVWCGNVQTALPASQMQEMDVNGGNYSIVRRKR